MVELTRQYRHRGEKEAGHRERQADGVPRAVHEQWPTSAIDGGQNEAIDADGEQESHEGEECKPDLVGHGNFPLWMRWAYFSEPSQPVNRIH